MNLREASREDLEAIREIARASLSESYTHFLDEETIEAAVEQWYGDQLAAELETDEVLVVVAETDDGLIGFSQSVFVGERHKTGQILWIHVDPDHRGAATGVRLLARTREELIADGADTVRATVLEGNEGGNEFYRAHGFEEAGTVEVEIGGRTYTENVFVENGIEGDETWRSLERVDLEGRTVYVGYGEAARGTDAPFYAAYESDDRARRYGWFCGNCDSLDNAMNSMGQIECNACGNRRKATRWDAAYL